MEQKDKQVTLFAAPAPFSNLHIKREMPEGLTVAEMLDLIDPSITFFQCAQVFINGELIPPHYWHRVRPKQGATLNVRVVPMGGGGKKSPLATLLSIAVTAAAPGLGASLAAGIGLNASATVFGSMTVGSLFGAAIGAVGNMLISALVPPPKPKSSAGFSGNAAESPTLFIEGASNSLDRYGVVPINLGTNRVFPKQCAMAYTETVNGEQYVRQLFCWGYGENLIIDDMRIGETPLSEFEGVQVEHVLNGTASAGVSLFSNDVYQDNYSLQLKQVDGYSVRTTQPNIDEIIVDITFDRGLCEFNSQGQRQGRQVQLEVQYSVAGAGVWSAAAETYTTVSGGSVTLDTIADDNPKNLAEYFARMDTLVVDPASGAVSVITGSYTTIPYSQPSAPIVPPDKIAIASVRIKRSNPGNTYTIEEIIDRRDPSQFGLSIETSSDFIVTAGTSLTVNYSGGGIRATMLFVTGSQTTALRRTVQFRVPNGQYDVRVRRITEDSTSDQVLDTVYWTALKSVTYTNPINTDGINVTALRIKASSQLNGAVAQFNAIVKSVISDYNPSSGLWEQRISSNPASIFRHVLQCSANARALGDEKIDLAAIEAWAEYCDTQGYSYNMNLDYEASLSDTLKDICAAGAASLTIVDGKYSVIVDRPKNDIIQIVTPRNSWGYMGEMSYPETPHAFRVEFRNAANGYRTDERIVYDDGYNETNATKFERLEYSSCTNSDLAFKHARRHLANVRLRPERHSFYMDVENLVATRGDRIKLVHDIPIAGAGYGRVKTVLDNGTNVTGVTIDSAINFSSSATYYIRIRTEDGTQLYKQLNSLSGEQTSLTFTTPFPIADAPASGDLYFIAEAGGELDLVISKILPAADETARIECVDYAPEIYTAESAPIPPYTSNLTLPFELRRPDKPVLAGIQSDERVMVRNSDGTFQSRMVISLSNTNPFDVIPTVTFRQAGTQVFEPAQIVTATAEQVILTGLQDGTRYDMRIYYRNASNATGLVSAPLEINNEPYLGASAIPQNVTNFRITVSGDNAIFDWDAVTDIDLSHYEIRFARAFSGVTWETAQLLQDRVTSTRTIAPFVGGTYLIKAVDLIGNKSETATAVITYEAAAQNAVASLAAHPSFADTRTNTELRGTSLILTDAAQVGYYTYDAYDLGEVYTSFVSAKLIASSTYTNNVFSMDDVFSESDIFGSTGDIFLLDDIFAESDIFGFGVGSTQVTVQARFTNDDPSGSPTWTDWQDIVAGNYEFRAIQARIKLESFTPTATPLVTECTIFIDMPDRVESGEDAFCSAASGLTVTYSAAFKEKPSVQITIQDGAADDRLEYTSKTVSGFTVKVYNITAAAYVDRSLDHTSTGFGRIQL